MLGLMRASRLLATRGKELDDTFGEAGIAMNLDGGATLEELQIDSF